MKTLFYTVEKLTQTIDTIEECTGWKLIRVYEIYLDTPKLWFELEVNNTDKNETEIQGWLDDSGFGDRKYEFVWIN